MEEGMKGIAIIRVSTEEQAKDGKAGIDRQRYDIEQAIKKYKITLIKTFEVKVSGTLFYNTEEAEEIDILLGTQASCVVVSSLDRFSRATDINSMLLMQKLIDKKVWLVTPERPYDPNDPIDFFQGSLFFLIGGLERAFAQQRMQGGKESLRKKGFHVGGQKLLPFGIGYRVEYKDGRKIPIFYYKEELLPRIMAMFNMIEQGIPYEQIAKQLEIRRSNIPVIATNKCWIGIREYKQLRSGEKIFTSRKKCYRKKCDRKIPLLVKIIEKPLLTKERFDRICSIIKERKNTRLVSRSRSENFLYTSILKCAECANPLYAKSRMKKEQVIKSGKDKGKILRHNFDYYTCSSYCFTYRRRKKNQGISIKKCDAHWQEKTSLEILITKFISEEMTKEGFFRNVVLQNRKEVIDDSKLATGIDMELEMLAKREQDTYISYRKGMINVERFNIILNGYQEDRAELETKKNAMLANVKKEDKQISLQEYFSRLAHVFAEFEFLGANEKKELSRNIFKSISAKDKEITGFEMYDINFDFKRQNRGSAIVGSCRGAASGLRVHFC